MTREIIKYSSREERLNAITHWIGFILGIVGLMILLNYGIKNHSILQILGYSIYGVCFIFLYLSSALYHSIQNKKAKKVLRVFDHCSIFLFIAGTYTPIILLALTGKLRIIMLILIWGICLFGVFFKIGIQGKFSKYDKLSLGLYLGLGWISVFIIAPLYRATSGQFIFCLFLGGVLYSVGSIFYAKRDWPYNHAIWHLFVLSASIAHYIGILQAFAI
ncbi:MAG: hemolysin III family protein [Tissierellia bacterium]|nr:hemolysin III family protein [Tissierellia bacterium]